MTTSSSATSGPGRASTRAVTSASRPSTSITTFAGLDVRRRVFEDSEVVAVVGVETVGGHAARLTVFALGLRDKHVRFPPRPGSPTFVLIREPSGGGAGLA